MSHQIKNNMIAYVGATPWHGLGTHVQDGATGQEMLVAAKLDWKVQRRALAMRDANGKELLTGPLAKLRAIARADNGTPTIYNDQVFQVATDRYHPLQNAEIVDFFREYCDAGHATMETVGALRGGAIVWALARLNGGSTANLGDVDELRGYMLLATSHDGSVRTIGKATQTRVVCWNTLSAALGEKGASEFRMKHSRKWTPAVAAEAKRVMGMAIEQIQEANDVAADLAKVQIDDTGRLQFVQRLLGNGESLVEIITDEQSPKTEADVLNSMIREAEADPKTELSRVGKAILEAIVSSPGSDLVTAQNTLWGAVNGVTYYVDHERGRTQDTRLANAWFGDGDTMKSKAVEIARSMAGVA